jgi:hypothetical protein
MPTKSLPAHPSIRHLQFQARDLQAGHLSADPATLQRIREFHPRFPRATDTEIASAPYTLADAYFTLAREYGFSNWLRLRAVIAEPAPQTSKPHHERITDPLFRRAVDLLDDGDREGLANHLRANPQLVRQRVAFEGENYFTRPSLLEFIAENPVRNGILPVNIADIATVILDSGATRDAINSTLILVASGRVARECEAQEPLIALLCDHGAAANDAVLPALVHAEFGAVDALLRHGAEATLAVAAGRGDLDEIRRLFNTADASSRHQALALSAQHGHADVVSFLLSAGEDPNRYNPLGCHSHSTPLHQAALAGHLKVVKTLIRHRARTDLRDTLFDGTPLGWAEHAKQEHVVAYLNDLSSGRP